MYGLIIFQIQPMRNERESKNVVHHKHEQTPKRDTMVTCIRGDGIKLPVFRIDTQRSEKLPDSIV